MSRIEPSRIATIILDAPGWARVNITAPSAGMREQAADELAQHIAALLEDERADPNEAKQIPLAL